MTDQLELEALLLAMWPNAPCERKFMRGDPDGLTTRILAHLRAEKAATVATAFEDLAWYFDGLPANYALPGAVAKTVRSRIPADASSALATIRQLAFEAGGLHAMQHGARKMVAAAEATAREEGRKAGLRQAAEHVSGECDEPIGTGGLPDEILALPPPPKEP